MHSMKYLAILMVLIFSTTHVMSQTSHVKVQLGPPHKTKDYFIRDIVAIDKAYFYGIETPSVFSKSSIVSVARYKSSSLEWSGNCEVNLGSGMLIGYLAQGDYLRLFLMEYNSASKKIEIYEKRINTSAFKTDSVKIKMVELPAPHGLYLPNTESSCQSSPKNSKHAMVVRYFDAQYTSLGYAIIAFDSVGVVWKKSFSNSANEYSKAEGHTIADNGDAYVILRNFSTASDQISYQKSKRHSDPESFNQGLFSSGVIERKPNYQFQLRVTLHQGDTSISKLIGKEDIFINEMHIAPRPSGGVNLMGLFGNKGRVSPRGCFYFSYDAAGDLLTEKKFTFSDDFLVEGMSEKEVADARNKLANNEEWDTDGYDTKAIVSATDGGAYMLVERHQQMLSTATTRSTTHHRFRDIYKEIIVCRFNAEGEMLWTRKVLKRQDAHNFYFASFTGMLSNDIFLFFNQSGAERRKGNVVGVSINAEGNISRVEIPELMDSKFLLVPGISKSLKDTQLVIYVEDQSDSDRFINVQVVK